MRDRDQIDEGQQEKLRLIDEIEQLRTTLEASEDEVSRLAQDRDRLLRRVTAQSRELQAANDLYNRALAAQRVGPDEEVVGFAAVGQEQEELRVAFEEMQVLTEELEVANTGLHEANRVLDLRVAERTRELAQRNDALAESELRFRTLAEGMPQLVWRSREGGNWTWASPQWQAYTGLSAEQSLGMGWLNALHPDDRAQAEAAWNSRKADAPIEFEARVFHRAENSYRHFRIRAASARSEVGEIIEWLGTSTDVDDLVRLQRRQQVLVAELQHRVRNILTVIRSVFVRTVEPGRSAEEIAAQFLGRLESLARTQVVVTQNAHGRVDLKQLILSELQSVGARIGQAVTLEGPDIALPRHAAESIGLAVHELTTNALKHGALGLEDATLNIRWTLYSGVDDARHLDLTWAEHGVSTLTAKPTRRGFGSELITEALPYRLGAETELTFRQDGVHCKIGLSLVDDDDASMD